MDKIEIIEKIAKEKLVEQIIKNIGGEDEDFKDLAQDIYISLLSKEDNLITSLYNSNQLNFFITRMCLNNIHSSNSPFYTQFRKNRKGNVNIDNYLDKM